MNNLDTEKFQVLSQDIATYPFRVADILFCKRKKYRDNVIYSGLDVLSDRYELFYEKICKSLDLLPDQLYSGVPFSSLLPKRIIGTESTTRVWRFPWSMEVNFDRVFSVPDLFLSGEILYEVLKFYYSKTCCSSSARQKARCDEYSYVKRISGSDFDNELFSRLRSERPMTEDQVTSELRNTIERIKTTNPPHRGAEGSSGSEEGNP
ncbi:MAG: hypothetical protein KAU94_10815 [Verrucomicrobia bacterium]|nr:hypothetical protein [Verrucomicrobiota bacterium]